MAWPSIQFEQTRECRMGRSASGTSRFGSALQSWKMRVSICYMYIRHLWGLTHISTMQLLLLMSNTLPPN